MNVFKVPYKAALDATFFIHHSTAQALVDLLLY